VPDPSESEGGNGGAESTVWTGCESEAKREGSRVSDTPGGKKLDRTFFFLEKRLEPNCKSIRSRGKGRKGSHKVPQGL